MTDSIIRLNFHEVKSFMGSFKKENQYIKNNNKYILIRMYLYNHTNKILIKFNWDFDAVIEYYQLTTY